ncbi:MAG TPA: FTR1 family protein [Dehalococcoidia bacterium]|nr:FTR1 family protein [Dehalococcoidia bacterium]
MLFSFLILLREGFEVALVLALVLAYLRQTGNRAHFKEVWAGAIAAALVCVGAGAGLELTATSLSGSSQEAFEGITMLGAVAVLTWMVFWMRRQARTIGRDLRRNVDLALTSGSLLALVSLAFMAVLREGLETTLLLFAGASAERGDSTALFLLGAAGGLAVAAVMGYAVYRGSRVLPLRQFFAVSGVIVLVLAAGLLSNGVAELQESGLISNLGGRPWDTDAIVSQTTTLGKFLHALLGYDSAPTWGQIVLYWSYLGLGLVAFLGGASALLSRFGRFRAEREPGLAKS